MIAGTKQTPMKFTISYLLLCGSLSAQMTAPMVDASDSRRGRISGIVLDERAQAVPGITVRANGLHFGFVPQTQTDASGYFFVAGVYPGRTLVNAFDEENFYPDALPALWDREGVVEVDVLPGQEVTGVLLALKPGGGRLIVNAVNAETGASIRNISALIERAGEPDRWIDANRAGNWWLVPTSPVRICISAEGFRPSWYGRDGSFAQSIPIRVSVRDVFVAKFLLQPQTGATSGAIACKKDGFWH